MRCSLVQPHLVAVTLHVIALASVIAIAFDPVRRLVAAFRAAVAAQRAPHPLVPRLALHCQVASLVRTDAQRLGATILTTVCGLTRLQDPRAAAEHCRGETRRHVSKIFWFDGRVASKTHNRKCVFSQKTHKRKYLFSQRIFFNETYPSRSASDRGAVRRTKRKLTNENVCFRNEFFQC